MTSFMDGPFEARLMWPLGNFLINFLSSLISLSLCPHRGQEVLNHHDFKARQFLFEDEDLANMLAFAICLLDCEWFFKHAGTLSRNLALFILGAFDAFYHLAHPPLCSCALLLAYGWSVPLSLRTAL